MALQSFSHFGISVSDLDRSTRFYVDVLGFSELFTLELGPELAATMELPGCRFLSRMLARPDMRLELLAWAQPPATGDGERKPMNVVGLTHLCVRVEKFDDLAEAAEAAGGKFHPQTRSTLPNMGLDGTSIDTVYLTDPDGVRIECIAGQPDLAEVAAQMLAQDA